MTPRKKSKTRVAAPLVLGERREMPEQTATPSADDGAGDSDRAHRGFHHLPGKEPVTTRSVRGFRRVGQAQSKQVSQLLNEPRAGTSEARRVPPVKARAA